MTAPTIKHSGLMFKPDMILAYLNERKNQTRRTKNLQVINEAPDAWDLIFTPHKPGTRFVSFGHKTDRANIKHIKMPYGGIGDQLYFKETWRAWEDPRNGEDFIQYRRDLALMEKLEVKSTVDDKETVVVQPTQADATGETDDGFTGKAVELKSTTGD